MISDPLTVPIGKQKLDGNLLMLGMLRKHLEGNALEMLNEVITDLSAASKVVLKQAQAKAMEPVPEAEFIRVKEKAPLGRKGFETVWRKRLPVLVKRPDGYLIGHVERRTAQHRYSLRVKLNSGGHINVRHRELLSMTPELWMKALMYPARPVEPEAVLPKLNGRWNQKAQKVVTIREQIIADMKNEFQVITHIEEVGRGAAHNRKYEGTVQVDGLPGKHNLMRVVIWKPEDVEAIAKAGYEFTVGDVAIAVTIKNDPRNFWRIDDVLSAELLESEEVA